jgi:hypothetical protein
VLEVKERAPVTTKVTTADVLNRAADLLEEFGWCQGRAGSKAEGTMCLDRAIGEAEKDLGILLARARTTLSEHIGIPLPFIWNDTPGRTKEEVVRALREAARNAQ